MTAEQRRAAGLAAFLLGAPPEGAEQPCVDAPEIDGFYAWQPGRGGGQVLVGRDGSALYGTSVLTYDQMVAAYLAGERTEPEGTAP